MLTYSFNLTNTLVVTIMFNYKKYIIFLSLILLFANFLSACGVKKELYRVEDENK